MNLVLLHGRHDPAENLDNWGFNGPVLCGVKYFHSTYETHRTVGFIDKEYANKAQELTGWQWWDDCALLMTFHEDLVKAEHKGEVAYFGDWELRND